VASLIDVEAIRESVRQQTIPIRIWTPVGSFTVTYRLRFSSGPMLTFTSGAIVISGRIDVTHPTYPDGWVSFKQRVTLQLDASNRVSLEPLGDPDVNDSPIVPHARASQAVRSEMNKALAANRPAVRRVFADALKNLTDGLQLADAAAGVHYTSVEITPDGIITRGEIVGSGRIAPVIAIEEALKGQAFSAFNGWIPAGTSRSSSGRGSSTRVRPAVMREAMAAHVSVQSDRPQGEALGVNTLVHFADLDDPSSLTPIVRALGQVKPRYAAVSLIVVVPPGTLNHRRREIDAKLSGLERTTPLSLHVTEDDEAGWTKTFAPEVGPATFLIDARRRLVWTSSGAVALETLARALEAHVIPAPCPRLTPLRLSVTTGDRVPDALFTDDREAPTRSSPARPPTAAQLLTVMVGPLARGAAAPAGGVQRG